MERELIEFFVDGLVIPAVINLCFELRNDAGARGEACLLLCAGFQRVLYMEHFYGHSKSVAPACLFGKMDEELD